MSEYRDIQEGAKQGATGERPDACSDEHLEYLDELRESGACNMYGARSYLMDEFEDLEDGEAASILTYWMKTFGKGSR